MIAFEHDMLRHRDAEPSGRDGAQMHPVFFVCSGSAGQQGGMRKNKHRAVLCILFAMVVLYVRAGLLECCSISNARHVTQRIVNCHGQFLQRSTLRLMTSSVLGALMGPTLDPSAACAETLDDEVYPTVDIDDVEIAAENLTDIQRIVLFKRGEEAPFTGTTVNGYLFDNGEQGVYISPISRAPLFSSTSKFDIGNGRASFWTPIDASNIVERINPGDKKTLALTPPLWRIEVLDRASLTHLGHVFEDSSQPTGKRYDINAAALCFIPGEAPPGDETQASKKRSPSGLLLP